MTGVRSGSISLGFIPGMAASFTACSPAFLAKDNRSGLDAGIRALPGSASPKASAISIKGVRSMRNG